MSNVGEFKVIFGNDMRRLAFRLGEEIFSSGSHPFENRLIVVPDISMKEFLLSSFAAHPHLQIAAGVQILPLNQAIMEIHSRIPSSLELSLAIEQRLHFSTNSFLERYLSTSCEKKWRRISSLSDQLAKMFVRYGVYGMEFLPKWLENPGWQQSLWKEIYASWTFPLEALKIASPAQFSGKLALFGFSYLPPIYLSFFSAIGTSLYQLSPCALFWEDMASDKERIFFARVLKKRGAKENVRDEIDQYLQQSHTLLGNWGKLGREMLKTLDHFEFVDEEMYDEPKKNELLGCLKKSLLTLEEASSLTLDDSIQVHSATSRLREVEILKDSLETLLQAYAANNDPIAPGEILVLSTDIAAYLPYIQMVFDQSSFAYSVQGIPLFSVSQAVQGFFQLLSLKEKNFVFSSVIDLFRCEPWMEKWGWSPDEVGRLLHWFKDAEIREGVGSDLNSWTVGIHRLLHGLAMIPTGHVVEIWPTGSVPHSEIDLFSGFLELFESIKTDLNVLEEVKGAADWLDWFLRLAEKYFSFDGQKEPFFQQLKTLSLSCRSLKQKVWNFESIKRVLSHLAQTPSGDISSSPHLQKVTFTSLRQGCLRPARIIWCLGMHEGAFPRSDPRSSLCEMIHADYVPSKTDEDRSSFLDLFLNAKDRLIFSFQRLNPEDGKQQGASLLIDELNQYLIKRGIIGGIVPIAHPGFPYDRTYFSQEGKVKKWSEEDYRMAQAHYFSRNEPNPFFVPQPRLPNTAEEILIDISQLKKLARHPIQFYFNQTLKIYLKEEEDEEEKEFILSFLRKAMLRKKAFKTALPQLMDQLRAKGRLPSGLFMEAALHEIEEEGKELLANLAEFEISPAEVASVRFSSQEQRLEVPLDGNRKAYITGTLEDTTPKGLIFHGSNDLKTLVRAWPLYLISLCVNPEGRKLFLTKVGEAVELPVVDPIAALSTYLDYFLLAKNSPSPLMPDWAESLLLKSDGEFSKAVSKKMNYEDAYLEYLKRRGEPFDPIAMFYSWNTQLRTVFATLINKFQ
jgi:exodeoxyribonuclease V gamma subunit